MWKLYDVTLLVIVSFKFYVVNFVGFMFNCYIHIPSHVSQTFASCTSYTSYSLLNIVHVIVCVFGLTNQVCKYFECYAKQFWCLKILILGKLGLKLCFWKTSHHILMHFVHQFECFEVFLKCVLVIFKNCVFSQKFCEPLSNSIDPICFSINRNCFKIFKEASVCFDQLKLIFNQSKVVN